MATRKEHSSVRDGSVKPAVKRGLAAYSPTRRVTEGHAQRKKLWFSFGAANVFMAPGALINIVDSSALYMSVGGYIHAACDSTWRGIFVHPGSSLYTDDELVIQD